MQLSTTRPLGWRLVRIGIWLVVLLAAGILLSLFTGVAPLQIRSVLEQWILGEKSKELLIFQTIRFPRAVLGAVVGANLAVAGALMQAVTRNPLASPQVFGVNAGAALAVVLAIMSLPDIGKSNLVYFAFAGAILGGFTVFAFAASSGMTNLKIALVGMAVHLLLTSITKGAIIFNEQISDVMYWMSGSISGAAWTDVRMILPWSIGGMLLALGLSGPLSVFRLGEEVAIGLGQNIKVVRFLTCLSIVILGGSSVSVAGSIGFVGLMIPHIVRKLVGTDYRVVVPVSAWCGAVLVTFSDVLARLISYPFESPVGIVTALLGTPFFLYLASKKGKEMV
ncbi:FecCD family ABC transporter permease [Brevibacillus nitrificans]|uniref:FecCD family ABC transporter permease n=1 Tax=Brevibacillus nitrificans TaxID=651560 RepID=UPI001FEA93BE|nr:iron ABC transporter permease [Brevibacillus nitrificans]